MIPPRGFKAELYPLRHHFNYVYGLTAGTSETVATIATFVKNYKGVGAPNTIIVNPHHGSFETETGAICAPMSIIDKFSVLMSFTLTEDALADGVEAIRIKYMPIFTSFAHRIAEVDQKSTTSVAAILELTSDATQEDITPAFDTKLATGAAANEKNHPVSTANFTEVFGTLNLTTNVAMEGVPFDNATLFKALRYYTNKGALSSCIGKMKTITLTKNRPEYHTFIRRPVPRDVRRIQPYSYFGMLTAIDIDSNPQQIYYTGAMTVDKVAVGVKMTINYHEWHPEHNQDSA